jgi:hypothetical protein
MRRPGHFPEHPHNYASINYTHALDELTDAGVNLILQLVAPLPGACKELSKNSIAVLLLGTLETDKT